jgi:DNA-binding XRE family transcriptional regulator
MAKEQAADRTAESFQGLLLRHRGRTGLTQRQLATRVGVSRGSLQGWEAGLNYSLPTPTPGSSEVGDEGLEPPAFRM